MTLFNVFQSSLKQVSSFKSVLKFSLFGTHGEITSLRSSTADDQTGNKSLILIPEPYFFPTVSHFSELFFVSRTVNSDYVMLI